VSAQLRLLHVREFLARLDTRFPEGIPPEYSIAIRAELAPLVEAAQFEVLDDELLDLVIAARLQ
jgi:hypothetical protein